MKGVNRQEVLHLIVGTIIIILLFWLLSSGLMDDALARLAQLNLYSDYVHHQKVIYLPIVLCNY